MGNCLKTQLKSAVVNNNLEVLGDAVWPLQPYSESLSNRMRFTGNAPFSIEIKGAGQFYSYSSTDKGTPLGKTINASGSDSVYEINTAMFNDIEDGDVLVIHNKYGVQEINGIYTRARLFKTEGEIDVTYLTSLTKLYLKNDQRVKFNVEDLRDSINLDDLYCPEGYYISGSIEEMVEGMLQNGKTSNSIVIYLYKSTVTLNNSSALWQSNSQYNITITFNSATNVVITDSNSATLATYDGSTWTYNS